MGNKSSKKKSEGVSGESRASRKRTSFKDSIRSLAGRRHKEPEEIPEDKGPKIKLEVPVENYSFPFENIVFEGGGYKCLAYCGAVRCLEELGIWRCVRRVAGSGSGAVVASLLSLGYNSYQLERYLSQDLRYLFNDHCCGWCCFSDNVRHKLGWNPAQKFYKWFGDRVKDASGNPDITFLQVYESFGRELCIAVTNVSQASVEYCHPKTTPNMPVRLAVKMSMTTPGVIRPVQHTSNDFTEYFVDGGITCNYPIHCFDGWWLSMKPGDSFLGKMNILTDLGVSLARDHRFSGHNERTLGFLVYGDHEEDALQSILDKRSTYKETVKPPDTKLAKTKKDTKDARKYAADKYADLSLALRNFLKSLKEHGLDESKSLTRNDLQNIISKKTELSDLDLRILFGKNFTVDSIFKEHEIDKNDTLDVYDLIRHADKRGSRYLAHYLNYRRRNITTIGDYVLALQETASIGTGLSAVKRQDLERTVGINTYHVGAVDYDLEREDRKFLVEQGKKGCKDYLEYYVSQKLPPLTTDTKDDDLDDMTHFIDDELSEIIDHRDYMEDIGNIV